MDYRKSAKESRSLHGKDDCKEESSDSELLTVY